MIKSLATTTPLALNFLDGSVPEWVQLLPAGPKISGRDGRAWSLPNPEDVVVRFREDQKRPQIDIEHASQLKAPNGDPAPAVGWIEDMEVREGVLWGKVEWNQSGRALIADRAYRYLSPAFRFEPGSGAILKMVSAGLTNNPNLQLAALNAEGSEEENIMDKAILEALGLNADATAADAVVAITKLKEEKATALNSAQHPDPGQFVPRADHDLALNRIATFEEGEKARRETGIEQAVDAAIEAGKIAPASRDYHLATCRATEDGLERFQAFVGTAPVIADTSGLDGKKHDKTATALNAEEKAAADALGLSHEDYATAKQENAQ
ncbi:phage protease [Maritimibacter sp. HL-12]|uniref:phage protease n=1 Tax=Maritimibacter sp. HL-12 TaxID=1162418 RepID=UPI000A0F1748|nr:phage protease [Maritimibacter sp. HL-12]SMH35908.1 Mu-like prophage I protein [Maritimibacter sp. HL-12]